MFVSRVLVAGTFSGAVLEPGTFHARPVRPPLIRASR